MSSGPTAWNGNAVPQYPVSSKEAEKGLCIIEGNDFDHLTRVRRAHTGSVVLLRDSEGRAYRGKITEILDGRLHVRVTESLSRREVPFAVTLYQALIKGKGFDTIIQKAVEVGVQKIVPIVTERTIPVLKGKEGEKRSRWEKIAGEAFKQCMGARPALIGDVQNFHACITARQGGVKIICSPEGGSSFEEIFSPFYSEGVEEVHLIVGPEGGFSRKEVTAAREEGWKAVTFGYNHLRAETAAAVLSALAIYEGMKCQ